MITGIGFFSKAGSRIDYGNGTVKWYGDTIPPKIIATMWDSVDGFIESFFCLNL